MIPTLHTPSRYNSTRDLGSQPSPSAEALLTPFATEARSLQREGKGEQEIDPTLDMVLYDDDEAYHPAHLRKKKRRAAQETRRSSRQEKSKELSTHSTIMHAAAYNSALQAPLAESSSRESTALQKPLYMPHPPAAPVAPLDDTLAGIPAVERLPLPTSSPPTHKQIETLLQRWTGAADLQKIVAMHGEPRSGAKVKTTLTEPLAPSSNFLHRATMDQMVMLLVTFTSQINVGRATELLKSQKIIAQGENEVQQLQLKKAVEEAAKAAEQHEKAKKGGLLGVIFSWVSCAVMVIAAAVCPALLPLAVVGIALSVGGAICETMAFSMGNKAPAWLTQLGMGLAIAGAAVTVASAVLTGAVKAAGQTAFTAAKSAYAAGHSALKIGQQFTVAFLKSLSQAVVDCVRMIIQWFTQGGKGAFHKICTFSQRLGRQGKVAHEGTLTAKGNSVTQGTKATSSRYDTVAENLNKCVSAAQGGVFATENSINAAFTVMEAELQKEVETLRNSQWFLNALLAHYRQRKEKVLFTLSDLFTEQGQRMTTASALIREGGSLQARIAGALV